jgi:hypothetical protein
MAPSKATKSRQGIKLNITVVAKEVATYEAKLMTRNEANKLDDLRSRLKSHFEKYKELSTQIQQELDDADAPQEDYDAEAETVRLTEEEVGAAKTILKTKLAEWDAIENKEKQEDWDRKEKLRLDDLARREKEKEQKNTFVDHATTTTAHRCSEG